MTTIPVLSSNQAAAWDRRAESQGIPLAALMECAGRAAAAVLAVRFSDRLRQGVLVAAGPGNNGGDGWVIARALHAAGVPVWVTTPTQQSGELTRAQALLAREAGVRDVASDGPWPNTGLVVDALLGTGATSTLRLDAQAKALGEWLRSRSTSVPRALVKTWPGNHT